jgi:hypothetical protein
MRFSDLIRVKPAPEPWDLGRLQELREMLDREGSTLSLMSGAAAAEILKSYLTPADPAADPLYRLLKCVADNGGRGAGYWLRGARNAGKTHLLAVATLLLEYPVVRPLFLATHEHYQGVLRELDKRHPILAVPVPLEEHRAHDEHLEDIFFDRTEAELRRSRYGLDLPLSEHSYALDLIERHVVPRYGAELDAHAARLPGTQRSWRDLCERNPAAAVAAARSFAQEIGYPLDFRQSRVERLARLLDIVNQRQVGAIVWLVDDLSQFLAASGQKAVRNDAAFLEFLGQRSKIAPLYVLATLGASLDQTPGLEPYMLTSLQDMYETLSVGGGEMRRVALERTLTVRDPEALQQAVDEAHDTQVKAWGQVSYSPEELKASYPLHPLALSCLESIYRRFLGEADALADFLRSLAGSSGQAAVLDRDFRHLVSLADLIPHLTSKLGANPQAAPYLHEALDYYEKSGPALLPEDPDLPLQLARLLVVLRLANQAAPVTRLVEALGLQAETHPRATAEQVRGALEQMRLRGRYIDVRRGATPEADTYTLDVEANYTEVARRHLLSLKASLTDDDARLWAAAALASGPGLPLAELAEPSSLEVEWANTARGVAVQTAQLAALSPDRLSSRCSELADPATVEDARLYLAEVTRLPEQRAAWREAGASLPRGRWAGALIAWLPRDLTAEELDRLKELAACQTLLQEAGPRYDPKVLDRLVEEASRLGHEVRTMIENAYAEGEVLSGEGPLTGQLDLARCRGDWQASLAAIIGAALPAVFPGFAAAAPRQLLSSREPVDLLVAQVLTPAGRRWDDDGRLGELTAAYMEPLKLAVREDSSWRLEVERSEVAEEVLARVRRRDQTPETEVGRPLACAELAQYMVKSAFGLPPELFELVIAALIRSGYLVPLGPERELLHLGEVQPPLGRSVAYVARSPLLGTSAWQDLARLVRILLERMVPRADYALQTELWEALLAAGEQQGLEITRLRKIVTALGERLQHPPEAWAETLAILEELEALFSTLDATLLPAEGLSGLLERVAPLLQGAPSQLAQKLRHLQALNQFLERTAPDVVTIFDYLRSRELVISPGSDLHARREQLLSLIASGEGLIFDETAFRRLVQIFLSVYKRRYIAWHARCYRPAIFDKYRSLRTSPEIRTLAALQQLELKVADEGPHALELIEAQETRRCTFAQLGEALETSPVCPQCHLLEDEEPQLVPLEEIREVAEAQIARRVARLRQAGFQRALQEYVQALPGRGELAAKLNQLLQLDEAPPTRLLLSLLSDDVIVHLNRVLSGKTIRPRDFGQLRSALAGRTLSKEEAQRLFQKWLAGEEGDEGDEVLHIEP